MRLCNLTVEHDSELGTYQAKAYLSTTPTDTFHVSTERCYRYLTDALERLLIVCHVLQLDCRIADFEERFEAEALRLQETYNSEEWRNIPNFTPGYPSV